MVCGIDRISKPASPGKENGKPCKRNLNGSKNFTA